jgi:hypothetical protein
MISYIPELPDLHLVIPIQQEPILKQLEIQNEEIFSNIKPGNKRLAQIIITEYGMSKNKFLDDLFKKYDNKYQELRIELQKFMNERKIYLEKATNFLR